MDPDFALRVGREALLLAVVLSVPVVGAAMVVGLIVSVLQAATQIHEQTLSFTPKLVAMFAVLAFAGLWMVGELIQFAQTLFGLLPRVAQAST